MKVIFEVALFVFILIFTYELVCTLAERIRSKYVRCSECGKKILESRALMDQSEHFCSLTCAKKNYWERGVKEDPLSP